MICFNGYYRPVDLPPALAAALAECTGSLQCLSLSVYRLTDDQAVRVLGTNNSLKILKLPHCPDLTDAVVSGIVEHCRSLSDLNLSWSCGLTEAALVQLVRRCRKLIYLTVSDEAMSQATAEALCAEERLYQLHVSRKYL